MTIFSKLKSLTFSRAESLHTHEEEYIELHESDDENVVQLTHQTPSCIPDECIEVNKSDDEDEVQLADLTPSCMLEEYLDECIEVDESYDQDEVQPADLTPSCMIEECIDLVESDNEEVVQLEIVFLPQETQFYLNLFQQILPDLVNISFLCHPSSTTILNRNHPFIPGRLTMH